MIEIERKFLVKSQDWDAPTSSRRIEQGYVFIAEDRTMRVRRSGEAYSMALKVSIEGIRRHEIEFPVDAAKGQRMLDLLCVEIPAEGEKVDVVGGSVGPRTLLAEAGDRAVDEAGFARRQGLVIGSQTLGDARSPALQHHVRARGEAMQYVPAASCLKVERDAAFAPVDARPHARALAEGVASGRLDLAHAGS